MVKTEFREVHYTIEILYISKLSTNLTSLKDKLRRDESYREKERSSNRCKYFEGMKLYV